MCLYLVCSWGWTLQILHIRFGRRFSERSVTLFFWTLPTSRHVGFPKNVPSSRSSNGFYVSVYRRHPRISIPCFTTSMIDRLSAGILIHLFCRVPKISPTPQWMQLDPRVQHQLYHFGKRLKCFSFLLSQ